MKKAPIRDDSLVPILQVPKEDQPDSAVNDEA